MLQNDSNWSSPRSSQPFCDLFYVCDWVSVCCCMCVAYVCFVFVYGESCSRMIRVEQSGSSRPFGDHFRVNGGPSGSP